MEMSKFGLGLRFDLLQEELFPAAEQRLWEEVFSVLTQTDVHNLQIYGGIAENDKKSIYYCVFTNGKLKQMRRLYRKLEQDAGIGMYLSSQHPFIQANMIRELPDLPYFGKVQLSGALEGGLGSLPGGTVIPKKHGKRRPVGRGIKILLAPQALSEEADSLHIIKTLTLAARRHFPGVKVAPVPVPKSSEDVIPSAVIAADGVLRNVSLTDDNGEKHTAQYGVLYGKTAVLDLPKRVCGDVVSSYDAGEIIRRVLDEGLKNVFMSVHGSPFTDGGMGLARALGVKFYDEAENELTEYGDCSGICRVDTELLHPRIHDAKFLMMCQAPQAELSGEHKAEIEICLSLLRKAMGTSAPENAEFAPGLPLAEILSVSFMPPMEAYFEAVNLEGLLKGVALAVTSEGRTGGKNDALPVLLKRCVARRVPVAMLSLSPDERVRDILKKLSMGVMPVVPLDGDENASDLPQRIADAADRMFHFIRIGRDVEKIGAPKTRKLH